MIHSLIVGFPLVIDYNYLIGFSKANMDVMNIILSNLKVMEQHDGNTRNIFYFIFFIHFY